MQKLSTRLSALLVTVAQLESIGFEGMNIQESYIFAAENDPERQLPMVQVFAHNDEIHKLTEWAEEHGTKIHGRRTQDGDAIECYAVNGNTVLEVWRYGW